MAANHEFFLQCWSDELPRFVRVLKALPADRLDYRPHEKNTAAGDLAWQLALEQANLVDLLESGVINFEMTKRPESLDAIVTAFETSANGVTERLRNVDETKWSSAGDFRMDGQSMWSGTVQDLCWGYLFDMIHHRGQLSTYLRPMGGKVPGIYGPSADTQ